MGYVTFDAEGPARVPYGGAKVQSVDYGKSTQLLPAMLEMAARSRKTTAVHTFTCELHKALQHLDLVQQNRSRMRLCRSTLRSLRPGRTQSHRGTGRSKE